MTINEAFGRGILKLRRDPWAQGEWLEIVATPRGYAPLGRLHSILDNDDVPEDMRIRPQDVPLWMIEQDGWEEHIDR